jgi:hypothetical protein
VFRFDVFNPEGVETRRQTLSIDERRYLFELDEGMVQTTNPKGAAKVVVGKHNPLVAGSNPAGPIFLFGQVITKTFATLIPMGISSEF